jgi:type IV secretory pathway VirB10-like protein
MNQKSNIQQSAPHQSIDISPKPVDAGWFNEDKFKNMKIIQEASQIKETAQEIEHKFISRQAMDLKKEELQDEYDTQLAIKKLEDKNMIQEKKLEWQAMQSPLSIDIPSLPGTQTTPKSKSSSGKDAINDAIDEISNMVKSAASGNMSNLVGMGTQLVTNINNQDQKQAFLQNDQKDQKAQEDDDYLQASIIKPRSRFEVKSGSFIPAALITGINSDLPGNVTAMVTDNVFDTITGNYLLIPQGAKLIGEYNCNLAYGQMRVQVVWNRIIFPDGKSIDIQKMQGLDISGYSGFHDKVNNHYFQIYGNAILLSLLGAGYDILNQDSQQQQYQSPRDIIAANVGQKLSDVSTQTLQKNMEVQPTLIISPGYKFRVMVMKDMVLEKLEDVEGTLSYTE